MELFYTPRHARVGDVIPFFEDGVFKPFYLKNWNPYWGEDRTDGWHMLTTTDHLHYTEQPTGICGGTGCVIRHDGLYHMFYCKFTHNPERQYVWHATSTDLNTWTELPEETFGPDPSIYMVTDWRDPFVFYNEEEQCWWMLLCTQTVGKTARRGCVGLCKSDDLHHWTCCPPLYAPDACMSAYECPDLFYMNGWWYLVFSQFTDRFQTIYRMSRSLNGPWIRPHVDSFDARPFYAAKTGSDGEHRYIYGWNPTRTQNTWKYDPDHYDGYDYNTWDWGGSLVVHKLVQHEDGTLGVKPVPAVLDAVKTENYLKWRPLNGAWLEENQTLRVDSPCAYACAISANEVPQVCRFETEFIYEEGTERIGIALQVDDEFARGYYFYFEPKRQRIEWKGPLRMHEQGGWTFPHAVELERPLKLTAGETYKVRIFVDDTVVILYVNDDVALSTRAYDLRARKFGLIVSDGCAAFSNTALYTR